VNRLDQETVKRRGPRRAVEPFKKKKKKKKIQSRKEEFPGKINIKIEHLGLSQ
jgi:hypothetical protein